jgi:hypothetical protein
MKQLVLLPAGGAPAGTYWRGCGFRARGSSLLGSILRRAGIDLGALGDL